MADEVSPYTVDELAEWEKAINGFALASTEEVGVTVDDMRRFLVTLEEAYSLLLDCIRTELVGATLMNRITDLIS